MLKVAPITFALTTTHRGIDMRFKKTRKMEGDCSVLILNN